MKLFGFEFGRRSEPSPQKNDMLVAARNRYKQLSAKYDAAINSSEHDRHWANADYLSPAAAADPEIRRKLRSRARYELQENSSLGKGICLKKSKDVVGTCPRLQVDLASISRASSTGTVRDDNRMVEVEFNRWARAVKLGNKLRTMYFQFQCDGESFAVESSNRFLPSPVKLDLALYEGDQVTTPYLSGKPNEIDGITFDRHGQPRNYTLLKSHPGGNSYIIGDETMSVRAHSMIHLFREDRPGQRRGIPHVTPALPLFAFRRRFLLATIAAAEIAADHAGVLQTKSGAFDSSENTFDAGVQVDDIFDIDRGMLTALPYGWEMKQMAAEHPTSTIEMFDKCLVAEMARCMQMPFNRAAGNSSGFTFASGKLDRDDYLETIEVEQFDLGTSVLDRVFHWWVREAAFATGVLPIGLSEQLRNGLLKPGTISKSWHFDRKRETDPSKQANADVTYWNAGLLPDDIFFQRIGIDPDDAYQKLGTMMERRMDVGAPLPGRQQIPSAIDEYGESEDADD